MYMYPREGLCVNTVIAGRFVYDIVQMQGGSHPSGMAANKCIKTLYSGATKGCQLPPPVFSKCFHICPNPIRYCVSLTKKT